MTGVFWRVLRSFLFRMDPEKAHRSTVRLIHLSEKTGTLSLISGTQSRKGAEAPKVFGMTFASRVGLAAGFDKDAELLTALPRLGFGFAEIGTVTPRPQPGNEPPRLFRDPPRKSLFNRMGFNGAGAEVVSRRLAENREKLPEGFRIGVNLGKNKDTPLELAAQDYARAASAFENLADYLVINVSSPNTPGLRSLQTVEGIRPIIRSVLEVTQKWKTVPPLLLKLAPELSGDDLKTLIREIESAPSGEKIDGWILTNTLGGTIQNLQGGWSGAAVTEASRNSLKTARSVSQLPIISVGGIMSLEEAQIRRDLGADLVQIYSGWIYQGPGFPAKLSENLK